MVGLPFEERLQELRRRELTREGEVGGRGVRHHRAGVEDRRLRVLRVGTVQRRERLLVRLRAAGEVPLRRAGVVGERRVRVHLLAVRLRLRERLRLFRRGEARSERIGGGEGARHRVAHERHRRPPARHGAGGVRGGDLLERAVGGVEPEGVQHRHRPLDVPGDRGRAGGGEGDGAERPGVAGGMLMFLGRCGRGNRSQDQDEPQAEVSAAVTPLGDDAGEVKHGGPPERSGEVGSPVRGHGAGRDVRGASEPLVGDAAARQESTMLRSLAAGNGDDRGRGADCRGREGVHREEREEREER
jgi:hypothetical protein